MGCASSKQYAPEDRAHPAKTVAEVIERVEKSKSATLDLSAAPAGADTPAGLLHDLGLSLEGAVPEEAFAATWVASVSFKCNQLGALSPRVAAFSALVTLDVSENALTRLPAEVGKLSSLRSLDCSENKLAALPAEVGELGDLETLVAFKNAITSVPDELGSCAKLARLNLYNNKLTKVPATLAGLGNLEDVNLGANKLRTLPKLDAWAKVRELRLHQNNLVSQFLPSFAGLVNVELLKLERNLALSELPQFGVHAKLEVIECNNCSLEALPSAQDRAGKGCEIPNFKGSYLGRFPLVLAHFWTSDHLSERSRP